ncbi:uncharacterized protein BDFB_004744 [Asbolus verrucosus]|uniref:Uncharacterized protein n=1 Tax=Asbolus verrucosus TaxID=1661398 RepID=A0A482W2D5_ASBVE|nr:uncharacterized protein BDFB_004744 [Asbolus verrucosus]
MEKKGGKRNRSKKKSSIFGASYSDPVARHKRKDRKCGQPEEPETAVKKNEEDVVIQPSLSTRLDLQVTTPPAPGAKYVAPVSKKTRKATEERHRQYEEQLKFCKYDILKMPSPSNLTKLDIKLKAASAEIKEAKVFPRKPSTTPSQLHPEPPKKKDLEKRKPKSGTVINEALVRRKKRIVKKKPKPPPRREPTIEELMAEELATIQEMAEGEEGAEPMIPENYLTKQFRRKVSQLSKSTSVESKVFKMMDASEAGEDEGEGEDEEEAVEEEEDRFISTLVQKFRRDSEIKRYERPKRKPKKGTFESFSFTRLKQPTLKTFYYGVKMATIHQGDEHFSLVSRNRQGICMSIAAYCFSILKHPDKWTQADIDEVLEAGNELFLDSAGTQHMHGDNIELKTQDLQKYCKLGTKKVRFVVSEPEVSGMVRSDDKKVYNLTKAINIFFGRYKAGILQTDTLNVAMWKDKHFYFFDAAPRTIDLFSSKHGAALMANFYDTTSIVTVLLNRSNLENPSFVIYSIDAYKVLQRDAEEVDSTGAIPELDNYQVLNEEKAVALGSFDLADKCFGFSRNKQALTIAVVALVYSKITPPSSWHKGTVDKIAIIGNQLFLECIENDEIEEVGLDHLPAVFTIGPYVVEIYISANRFVDFMFKKGKCVLQPRLEKFFETSSNAVVQIDNSTLAVWKQRNMYLCFDPYSRNNEALKCRDGAACISMHTTLTSLIQTISANFDQKDMIFHVHALKVCKIHRDPDKRDLFPKSLTMNDFPIESFKKVKMRRGKRRATMKPVTVDHDTRATIYGELPDGSIMEVGSTVKSIDIHDLPPMCHKVPSRPLPAMAPPDKDFVADLDSPSLSDTQIEPPPLEEPEGEIEIEFMDLDSFQLTQEELELETRGEGEGKDKGGEDEEDEEGDEEKSGDASGSADAEAEATKLEERMAKESMQEGGEEWYMAASDFTQVGSHSLLSYPSRMSQEVNTEYCMEIPEEEVPAMARDIRAITRKHRADAEGKYDFQMTPEPDVSMSEELRKDTNFLNLPDDSQIVLGTKNMAQFGADLEIMAPFISIMAATVAKKYAIDSWSKEIVDYVLKCGAELHENSNTRYDQNYKLEIAKISLGSTDFNIRVDYIFDTYIKPRVLAMAISKMLFPKCPSGILVTPTYSCALFYKNHLYYLFDGFGNNEVGLAKGPSNEGVACFCRFKDINCLVARIIHNKSKREEEDNIEYNRFVLSSCYVKQLPREEITDEEDEEELLEQGEGADQDEPVEVQTYKKKKEQPEPKPSKMGYHLVDGLYKIQGNRVLGGAEDTSDFLKEDYFVCLCACLLLLNNPLKKWDDRKVDAALDQGTHVFSHAEDLDVCSKKFIKNILIDDYLFDIVANRVKFTTYEARRTLKSGIETMMSKKHEHFILQFPNRCYCISVDVDDKVYHIFDPNDKSGKASWTKYKSFRKLVKRIRSGLVSGGESYNFHSFEIMSIAKAPRHVIVSNRAKRYRTLKDKKQEMMCKPFHEEFTWLDVDPIPWSWRVNKTNTPMWNGWYVDFPDDLFSLFGTISPFDPYFPPETRGKQTLGNLVVAIGMIQIYDLVDWTVPIMDSVLIYGNAYFQHCIKDITNENYEVAFDDIKEECRIFPYSFRVKFTPVVEGTIFLVRLKQFNLYKALRLFFDEYERRFGIICVTKGENDKRVYAFGKVQESEYFLYDCETLGPPMYVEKNGGVPYILRTTTLNRLLHVMTVTLRGGDFYIFDVGLSELKSYMK